MATRLAYKPALFIILPQKPTMFLRKCRSELIDLLCWKRVIQDCLLMPDTLGIRLPEPDLV